MGSEMCIRDSCSLDVVVASGWRVSGRKGRQMIKRGLPRETGSHRMLRAAISIKVCDQHVANYCVYDQQADATQTCDSWCNCDCRLANRMRVCNNQAANHTRECSAETGTRQPALCAGSPGDDTGVRGACGHWIGCWLVRGSYRCKAVWLRVGIWDLRSVCLCHVYFICMYSTSHADSRKSSDSSARCCRCRHISSLRGRGSELDHLNAIRLRGCIRATLSR